MEPKKPEKVSRKKWVIHCYDPDARYNAALIANLYQMNLTDVVSRAIICYANALRIHDKMEERFPQGGAEVKPLKSRPVRQGVRLTDFEQHKSFFKAREKSEEPT